jgi:AcrR family transcriptional regulator
MAMTDETPRRRGRPPAGGREAILHAALELLRERGIGRLRTREIAGVAGVSEASIFYHYGDRTGLLMAVFEEGLRPLKALAEQGEIGSGDRREVLTTLGSALERFLDQAVPVLNAAQSDIELRDALASYMAQENIGPHRGVEALGNYLAREQAVGRVRDDIDPHATALMLVGTCFMRVSQRQMPVAEVALPALEDVIATLDTMLARPGRR